MRAALALAITALALAPQTSLATVGGEVLLDVWGWDARHEGVVVQVQYHDGSGAFDPVFLMRPGEPDVALDMPGCVHREDRRSPDSECATAIRLLRNALEPLAPDSIPAIRLPFNHRIVRADSVSTIFGPHPRFLVEARFDWTVLFRVTTFYRTEVSMVARYPLPDREVDLVLLSFFGTEFEGGYETWVAVFVPRRGVPPDTHERSTVMEVEWRPRR